MADRSPSCAGRPPRCRRVNVKATSRRGGTTPPPLPAHPPAAPAIQGPRPPHLSREDAASPMAPYEPPPTGRVPRSAAPCLAVIALLGTGMLLLSRGDHVWDRSPDSALPLQVVSRQVERADSRAHREFPALDSALPETALQPLSAALENASFSSPPRSASPATVSASLPDVEIELIKLEAPRPAQLQPLPREIAPRVPMAEDDSMLNTPQATNELSQLSPDKPAVCSAGGCDERRLGTAIHWARSVEEAAGLADEANKLVFVIHVSGNFEIAGFT